MPEAHLAWQAACHALQAESIQGCNNASIMRTLAGCLTGVPAMPCRMRAPTASRTPTSWPITCTASWATQAPRMCPATPRPQTVWPATAATTSLLTFSQGSARSGSTTSPMSTLLACSGECADP